MLEFVQCGVRRSTAHTAQTPACCTIVGIGNSADIAAPLNMKVYVRHIQAQSANMKVYVRVMAVSRVVLLGDRWFYVVAVSRVVPSKKRSDAEKADSARAG